MDTTPAPQVALIGTPIESGDHICVFYRGREDRDRLLSTFLLDGLRADQKCLYLGPEPHTDPLVLDLRAADPRRTSDLLRVEDTTDHYLADGRFAGETIMKFWETFALQAYVHEQRPFGRAACEVTWVQGLPAEDLAEFVEYEKGVTKFCRAHPQVGLCLYDLTDLPGSLILLIIGSHPKVLLSEMVVDNPYCLDVEDLG